MKRDQVHERHKGQVFIRSQPMIYLGRFILSHLSINLTKLLIRSVFDRLDSENLRQNCKTTILTYPYECKLWYQWAITVFITANKVNFSSLNFVKPNIYFPSLFPESGLQADSNYKLFQAIRTPNYGVENRTVINWMFHHTS